MKKMIVLMMTMFVSISGFAKVTGSMPDWKWDSKVMLSEYVWYADKTVRDLFGTHRSLMAGPEYSGFDLSPVVGFSAGILLDHDKGYRLHLFIGGESLPALITHASSAY